MKKEWTQVADFRNLTGKNMRKILLLVLVCVFAGAVACVPSAVAEDELFVDAAAYTGDLETDKINYDNGFVCVPKAQGDDNWFAVYGKGDGAYSKMTDGDSTNSGNTWKGSAAYNSVWWRQEFAPDGGDDAIALWRAPYNGTVKFTGKIQKTNMTGSDGVEINVFNKKGVEILSESLYSRKFTEGFTVIIDREFAVVSGEMFLFCVGQLGTSSYDTTVVQIKAEFTQSSDPGDATTGDSVEPVFSADNLSFLTEKAYYTLGTENEYYAVPENEQGENNFYVLYGDATKKYFRMSKHENYWAGVSTYNQVWWRQDFSPDGGDDAILMWKAPFNGVVRFQGKIYKSDDNGSSDGVKLLVHSKKAATSQAEELYGEAVSGNFIRYFSGAEYAVQAGQMFFFSIDQNGTSAFDSVKLFAKAIFEKDEENPGEGTDDIGEGRHIDHLGYYSDEQGGNDWYYAYGTLEKYVLMTYGLYSKSNDYCYYGMEDYQCINAGNMTPGSNYAVMRIWVAANAGKITVDGTVLKNTQGGDGCVAAIYKNGEELFRYEFGGDADESDFDVLRDVEVNVGDKIIYYVSSGAANSNAYDNVTFKTELYWEEKLNENDVEDTSAYLNDVTKLELLGINIVEPELDENGDYGTGCGGASAAGLMLATVVGCLVFSAKRGMRV